MSPPPPARRALYSLHDVTPAKEALVFQAIAHLRSLGVAHLALLVVPDFHGRADLRDHPGFCRQLREHIAPGDEILLHGYFHLADVAPRPALRRLAAAALTAGEGEFHDLDYAAASQRLRQGLEVLQEALGLRPSGFVAPAWLQNAAVRRAVADAGLAFCEDQLRIWPAQGAPIAAPALSFASRSPLRLWGSLAAAEVTSRLLPRLAVSRVAIHPNDYREPALCAAIGRVVARWQETAQTSRYAEVLP